MEVFEIKKKFIDLYENQPDIIIRSPARINLIGEHTDYNEGFVLPAAIDKQIHFAMTANGSDQINLYSLHYKERAVINLESVTPSDTVWLNYISGVVDQFQKAGYHLKGFDCTFGGNVPLGAGLSSSAAITCGIGYGLNELFQLDIKPRDLMRYAQQAEHTFAGVQCGIMDQFANIIGRKQHAIKLDCRSLDYEFVPLCFDEHQVILCDTKVKHSLANSAYNTRKEECLKGLSIIKEYFHQVESLQDVTFDMLQQLSAHLGDVIYKRCRYVLEENERVLKASQQLKNGDIIGFGKNLYESHHGLSHLYDVSCAELDFLIAQAANKPFVAGARMMGGGFGGCTINIVNSEKEELFIKEITTAYNRKFSVTPGIYKVKISNGTSTLKEAYYS